MFFNFAQQSIAFGKPYPNLAMTNADYIVSPVYVNYNILLLSIFNSPFTILYLNIVLNLLQLLLIYRITYKIFGEKSALIVVLIYMLYLTNLGIVLLNLTELLFGVLIFASINFYFSKEKFWIYFLCGIFAGLALGVRPMAYSLILSYLIIYLYQLFKKQNPNHQKMAMILSGVFVFIILMGSISKKNFGYFIYTAGTGPLNLSLSSNDVASGTYDESIIKNDSILKTKTTVQEKNEYLMNKSIIWIKKHPVKFFSTIPKKIYTIFISDDFTVSQLAHTNQWDFNKYIKSFKNAQLKSEFNNNSKSFKIFFVSINIFHQLFYLSLLALFIYQFVYFIKNRLLNKSIILIYLVLIISFGLTVLATIGTQRYKYPIFLFSFILISPVVNHFYQKVFKKSM
jgi:hypothetical protein